MSERTRLLQSIATIITDYRAGEIPTLMPAHVERWIDQFSAPVQEPILTEMEHVLGKSYINKTGVKRFLSNLVNNPKISGATPCSFWRDVSFLDIQSGGHSQHDMLAIFSDSLNNTCRFTTGQCGSSASDTFIYIDDVLFTGNRIMRDLTSWIQASAPLSAKVHVINIGLHKGGQYYARGRIQQAATAAGKAISLTWWRAFEIEDRRAYTDTSDVLRPTVIPAYADVQAYVQSLGFPPLSASRGTPGR
jgi:hypothetical protein